MILIVENKIWEQRKYRWVIFIFTNSHVKRCDSYMLLRLKFCWKFERLCLLKYLLKIHVETIFWVYIDKFFYIIFSFKNINFKIDFSNRAKFKIKVIKYLKEKKIYTVSKNQSYNTEESSIIWDSTLHYFLNPALEEAIFHFYIK